ncbi:MAG: anthranilate synthase component I [bacterium]
MMKLEIVPGYREFERLARRGNIVIVSADVFADMLTPVSAFLNISHGTDHSFLLESVVGGERAARYSFLGTDPHSIFKSRGREYEAGGVRGQGDPLEALDGMFSRFKVVGAGELPPFVGGAVGYFGYDMVRHVEVLPDTTADDLHLPDSYFMLTDAILIFDHLKHKIRIVCSAHTDTGQPLRKTYEESAGKIRALHGKLRADVFLKRGAGRRARGGGGVRFRSNVGKEDYLAMVRRAKRYIRAGDVFQVVLSQRFQTEVRSDPFDIYRVLRSLNPSPYMFYLHLGELRLIGSSPEILVTVRGREVVVRPIAGTRPRPGEPSREDAVIKDLLSDEKERAEHIMLVDLGRNDVGRVSEAGTVKVDDLMAIEKYSHVIHIVSNVQGRLRRDRGAIDAFRACFPAGTVSGAPKVRAMEIIDELESVRRGPYAGAVSYISYSGFFDSCITIRTIVLKGRKAYIQAGGGIVADSVPEREYQESVSKARALMRAIEIADGGVL